MTVFEFLDVITLHPFAALVVAAWSLGVLYMLQETIALIATGERPPAPPPVDLEALIRREDLLRWLADRRRADDYPVVQTPPPVPDEAEADEDRAEEVTHDGFECSRVGRVN